MPPSTGLEPIIVSDVKVYIPLDIYIYPEVELGGYLRKTAGVNYSRQITARVGR